MNKLYTDAKQLLREAILITAIACVIGLVVNLFHPEKIDYIAREEYETFVPCPEPQGDIKATDKTQALIYTKHSFIVDARIKEDFDSWHFHNAVNIPYDYLDPTPPERLKQLAKNIAHSHAKQVIVYGDGDNPDTGEQLAKEISVSGIKNVYFFQGGAPTLMKLDTQEVAHE